MRKSLSLFIISCFCFLIIKAQPTETIYKEGWIDLNKNGKMDPYENPSANIEDRIANLISLMTIEEKTAQMVTLYGYGRILNDELPTPNWKNSIWQDGLANIDEHLNGLARHPSAKTTYSFPFSKHAEAINTTQKWFIEETRLGIPVDFSNEGIHGLCHDRATPLPAPINIGSTWNKALVRSAGQLVGREAKYLGYTNVYAPILDVARDPRWGRIVECYSENPYLIAQLGKQMVIGIQENGVASTLKHYAAYSIPKGGRDGDARTDPHVALRELHSMHLYPFKYVIKEAQPKGIMSSYNDYDGEPISGSYYFLTELLRNQYGFNGYVVSDSEALEFIERKHHVVEDYNSAIKMAAEAGLDVRTNFTAPDEYLIPLRQLVHEGKIETSVIDKCVANVLRVKFELGLFDEPYSKNTAQADLLVHTQKDEDFAEEINKQSIILLKNEGNLLPLDKKKLSNILVTGPLAEAKEYAISRYGPSNNPVTSILDGIQHYAGDDLTINYTKGCDIVDATWPESEIIPTELTISEKQAIAQAVALANSADVVIAVVGENERLVGESLSRTGLNLPGRQLALLMALKKTGKPIILVLVNGRPLTINWENKYLPAILETWFPGPQSGHVVAKTLFGEYNPGGKLPVTFPKSVGQLEYSFPFKPAAHANQPASGNNGYGKTRVNGALYPFGYGLSYTTFEYSNLILKPQDQTSNMHIRISIDITNTGQRKGDEIVQLYVKDMVSSVTTYEYDLRGFERVSLQAKEKKTVTFDLAPEDFALLDIHRKWVVEPGDFKIMVGSSSEDIKLTANLNYTPPTP